MALRRMPTFHSNEAVTLWDRAIRACLAYENGWHPADVATVAALCREHPFELVERAWVCYLRYGEAFVEVSPRNFIDTFEHWVRLSGPAVTAWK